MTKVKFNYNYITKNKYKNLFKLRLPYPEKKFVIYTRGRTGSTVLTELLNCHPEIYCDVEIFNYLYCISKVRFPGLYINSCSKRAAKLGKSTYGFKVKIAQLRYEHNYLSYEKILTDLHSDGWKFIYLKRDNFLRHKLSNILSSRTKIFHLKNGDINRTDRIQVDCNELLEGIEYSEEVEQTEEMNLKSIPHLKLIYENDILDNSRHQLTADKVFSFLGLRSAKVKTDLKRIVPDNLKETIINYEEVFDFLKDTKYSKFLNSFL